MNAIERTMYWGETHHPAWLDPVRVVLGLILFIKGIFFIRNLEAIEQMVMSANFEFYPFIIAHYVAFAHLIGGLLIAGGLLTRVAALFQIPILIGAVFFVNASRNYYSMESEGLLAIVVLILLIVFLVVGSGKYSLDHYMKTHKDY